MFKPENWDAVPAITGSFQSLPAGVYVIKVNNAYEGKTKNGKVKMVLEIDIAEGEFKDFFAHQVEAKKRFAQEGENVNWPCLYHQVVEGDERTIGRYKGLVVAFERSNADYHWDFNEHSLCGLVAGCIFGEEEYRGKDNKIRSNCKAKQIIPVDEMADARIPEKKKLEQNVEEDYGPIPW